MTSIVGNNSERFGDTPVAFSLRRYESAGGPFDKGDAKWFFSVRKYCGGDALIEAEATLPMLRAMQRWIERSIETVSTDGGRGSVEKEAGL